MKKVSGAAIWIVISIVLIFASVAMVESGNKSQTISYSEFQQKWKADEIQSINGKEDGITIEGKTRDNKAFVTHAPENMLDSFMKENPKTDVKVTFEPPTNSGAWLQIIPSILLIVLFWHGHCFVKKKQPHIKTGETLCYSNNYLTKKPGLTRI